MAMGESFTREMQTALCAMAEIRQCCLETSGESSRWNNEDHVLWRRSFDAGALSGTP